MATPLNLGIMGAGAIGCYLGGQLVARGANVVFVARGRIYSEVATHGLSLVDMDQKRLSLPRERVEIDTDPSVLASAEVVLVCVKSAQTSAAADQLASVLRPDAIVVSMQNGIGNTDVLKRALGNRTVLGGVVGFNVICEDGGVFRQATTGPLAIEASRAPSVITLSAAFEAAGFDVELPEDIRRVQWSKLVVNLNNAVSALSGAPSADLLFVPGYRRIVRALMAEALDVMRAAGARPGRLGPLPVGWFPTLLALPTALLRVVAGVQMKFDEGARSSMWEDLARGRLTEVDYLNGEIVKLADACGAKAPLNRKIVELVHQAERAGQGSPRLSPEAFWKALEG